MSDEVKKRGRPKKEVPPTVISEEPQQLEMAVKESNMSQISIKDVQASLHSYYQKALGFSTGTFNDNIRDLSRYNPFLQNQRLKMLNTLPGEMTREELNTALRNPQNSEEKLRAQSWSLSSSQYLYYKILRMAADIPMFKYYKIPEYLEEKDYGKDAFLKEDAFVNNWLETFDLVNTFKRIALEVKREGKPTYVLRNCLHQDGKKKLTDYATLQKLPSNYIKLIGIGQHGFIASFNMMIFLNPAILPEQYPEFISNVWYDMIDKKIILQKELTNKKKKQEDINGRYDWDVDFDKLNTYSYDYTYTNGSSESLRGMLEITREEGRNAYMFWVPLPQDLCYTFCNDNSQPWAAPDTSGLFLGLQELTDYDTLAGLLQSTPLSAVLTGEIEPIKDPQSGQDQTIMNPETIAAFQDKFNLSTSSNLEAFFAPVTNMKLLSLPDIPNANETSTKATTNFVTRAGLGGLLALSDKPTVTQVKTAQLIAEAECDFVTKQFESIINLIVNKLLGCNYHWKIVIWGNIFSYNEELKRDKELWMGGATFILPKIASAYNMSIADVKSTEGYLKAFGVYKDFKTVTQEQQAKLEKDKITAQGQIKAATAAGAGRPQKETDEIENDNTAASTDSGLDRSDTKNFVKYSLLNHKCMLCGSDADNILCEECHEKYFEDGGDL